MKVIQDPMGYEAREMHKALTEHKTTLHYLRPIMLVAGGQVVVSQWGCSAEGYGGRDIGNQGQSD